MEYCPHCMQPTTGAVCTHCGGQVHWTAPATQLPLGTLLRGPSGRVYQVGAAKGQGGFGITYAAMDLMNNQRVAIKEYYPTRCATRDHMNNVLSATGQLENFQGGMRSFLEEARMLSAVGALPSVVSVRDYFESNGTAYLVMEYVDGEPLHQVVARQGRMTEEQLLPMLPNLLRDLDILHRAGVIHRDISPDNLILTPQGSIKLLDFGSARSVQDGKSMTVMLKAGFSPVEQYQSKGQGPYTDVYALAGTVYYCLTGKIPPTAIDRISEDTIRRPNEMGANLPVNQEEALLWGLTVQPKMRPQSMAAFANAMFPAGGAAVSQGQPEIPLGGDTTAATTHTGTTHTGTTHTGTTHTGTTFTGTATGTATGTGGRKPMNKGLLIGILSGAAALVAAAVLIVMMVLTTGTTSDGFKYRLRGGDAYITGYEGSQFELEVPGYVEGNVVVGVRSGAFSQKASLKTVTLPDSVTTLDKGAFKGCSNLELVILQNKNITVEAGAFEGCGNLRCILAPNQKTGDRITSGDGLAGLDDVAVCYIGQTFAGSKLQSVQVSGGIAYGVMDNRTAVVLQLPSGKREADIAPLLNGMRVFSVDGERLGAEVRVTDDNYLYETIGGEVVIVGYTGTDTVLIMPDEVDGVAVTGIAAGSFAGNEEIEAVFFPMEMTSLGAGAFANCSGMTDIYVYSNAAAASDAFSGCSRLRCVVLVDANVSGWNLPAGCLCYDSSEETGAGTMRYAGVDDQGIVYAVTSEDVAVVLDIPAGLREVTIPETIYDYDVTWVHKNALKNASADITINMAPGMGFPFELWKRATWNGSTLGSFSYNWVNTCMLCEQMNMTRSSSQPRIAPDVDVVRAAMTRAKELYTSNSHTRPNGNQWSTILDDVGVNWDTARTFKKVIYSSNFASDLQAHIDEIPESFNTPDDDGQYFVLFGWAAYRKSAGSTVYCNSIAVTLA